MNGNKMNTKLLADIESVRSQMAAIVCEDMARLSMADLIALTNMLSDEPERSIALFMATRPKDFAAMLSIHYYNELLRRIECEAMEGSQSEAGI